MHSLFSPTHVMGLKYTPVPVTHSCYLCRRSSLIYDSGTLVKKGFVWCPLHERTELINGAPCPQYVPPTKTHTLRVDLCWRNRYTGREFTPES